MSPIGERIKELRNGWLSQQELADRAGISVELVRKLEQGVRERASVVNLQKIATVLDVDITQLFAKPAPPPTTDPNAGIVAIRRVLTSIDELIGHENTTVEPVSLHQAERTVSYLWGARWAGKYELLVSLIPNALTEIRATYREASSAEKPKVAALLARTYKLTAATLGTLGQHDAGFFAVMEALRTARDSDDELLYATLHISVAEQVKEQGRYEDATRVALAAARRIAPAGQVSEDRLAAHGLLTTTASMSAARAGENDAEEMLREAVQVASRIGYERAAHDTTFGPAKVAMLFTTITAELEDFTGTLNAGAKVPRDADLPTATRVALLTNVALAHSRLGNNDKALDALLAAEQASPECVKYQTYPLYTADGGQIASELLSREKKASPRLRELAARIGADRR